MKIPTAAFLALLLAGPAAAQPENPAVAGQRALYDQVKNWLLLSAQQMPEADFAFRPTPEVRTFGQLIGHVANAQYMFCSVALGEQSPSSANAEQLTSKAELIRALQASHAYCDRAFQITDATALQAASVFGQQQTRLFALSFNVAHDMEHYGNIVTYMRMKGMVPPSSAGGGQ
jgi:uncharacterized damage-inducible protein DinB